MNDIWNPWHGCIKKSEGCAHCYMYAIDGARGLDGSKIYKVKSNFSLPLQRFKNGDYKIPSGAKIRVCMNSDFFLKEADDWREEAWDMIRKRRDVIFYLLTKRPENILERLPRDWDEGWENVSLNVTTENQKRADERLSILLNIPARHKGIMAAPLLGPINIESYLIKNQLEYISAGGENYAGARPCHYDWVHSLYLQAVKYNVSFSFYETGEWFVKDGKTYHISRELQRDQALKSGLYYSGRNIDYRLSAPEGEYVQESLFKKPKKKHYGRRCRSCKNRSQCLGCIGCGQC